MWKWSTLLRKLTEQALAGNFPKPDIRTMSNGQLYQAITMAADLMRTFTDEAMRREPGLTRAEAIRAMKDA